MLLSKDNFLSSKSNRHTENRLQTQKRVEAIKRHCLTASNSWVPNPTSHCCYHYLEMIVDPLNSNSLPLRMTKVRSTPEQPPGTEQFAPGFAGTPEGTPIIL